MAGGAFGAAFGQAFQGAATPTPPAPSPFVLNPLPNMPAKRTYGRVTDEFGKKTWILVTTDANGFNDMVYVTTLAQVLKLNLGESPFYGKYGIPAKTSVIQQIFPDFNATLTQQQFAQYFASLIINRVNVTDEYGRPVPTYNVYVVTNYGAKLAYNTAFGSNLPSGVAPNVVPS